MHLKKRLAFWMMALIAAVLIFGRGLDRGLNHDEHQFFVPALLWAEKGLLPYRDFPMLHMPLLVYGELLEAPLTDYAKSHDYRLIRTSRKKSAAVDQKAPPSAQENTPCHGECVFSPSRDRRRTTSAMQRAAAGCLTVLLLLLLGVIGISVARYGGLVAAMRAVDAEWIEVQKSYQTRAEIALKVLESAAAIETTDADFKQAADRLRSELGRGKIETRQSPFNERVPREAENYREASRAAIRQFFSGAEAHPELADATSRARSELAQVEKQLVAKKSEYDRAVTEYNRRVRRFPTIVVAGMMGFVPKPMFAAQPPASS